MEGDVFVDILNDLKHEGMTAQATEMERLMREDGDPRAEASDSRYAQRVVAVGGLWQRWVAVRRGWSRCPGGPSLCYRRLPRCGLFSWLSFVLTISLCYP